MRFRAVEDLQSLSQNGVILEFASVYSLPEPSPFQPFHAILSPSRLKLAVVPNVLCLSILNLAFKPLPTTSSPLLCQIYEKFGRIFARLPLASVIDNQVAFWVVGTLGCAEIVCSV